MFLPFYKAPERSFTAKEDITHKQLAALAVRVVRIGLQQGKIAAFSAPAADQPTATAGKPTNTV